MKKYDVFISSKSEDYPYAEDVYNFLCDKGLRVFFADKELEKMGEDEYGNAIDEALDATAHMIVVASSCEHVKSKWVKYEWRTFRNDINSEYREGNLLTVLIGIEPKVLPAGLRHQQSFNFDGFCDGRILNFLKIDHDYDVFLSYSRKDQALALGLYESLKLLGLKVFYDMKSLSSGVDFNEQIVSCMEKSKYFVPILSHHLDSEIDVPTFYRREWAKAIDISKSYGRRFLIPIVEEGVNVLSPFVPREMQDCDYIQYSKEQDISSIAKRLYNLVSVP